MAKTKWMVTNYKHDSYELHKMVQLQDLYPPHRFIYIYDRVIATAWM
jgi:hypothetical protein